MHLFIDYVEPLTNWLRLNPNLALFITLLISFAESLAIIGSIVPGSLTMTAIGILSGSGVMPIDLTLVAAIIGAIAGDSASYALGKIYSDRLVQIWPFRKYPSLIFYGKDFFVKHGGKSVIIGRFIGPLRSIIPVIAGIMNMPRLLFFISNLISAIGWSILYIMPGYLVGAASNQLTHEGARRLFGLIIMSLFIIWISSKTIHYVAGLLSKWYNSNIEKLYNWLIKYNFFQILLKLPKNKDKTTNNTAISLIIIWLISIILTLLLSLLVIQNAWINSLNGPISFFLYGLRAQYIDISLIIINLATSPIPLLSIFSVLIISSIIAKDMRLVRYLISLAISSILAVYLISSSIDVPNITNIFQLNIDATFPVISLTWATALYSFIIYYIIKFYRKEIHYYLLRIILVTILCLSGISTLYLGDNWFSGVIASYLIGIIISTSHFIMLQRKNVNKHQINITAIITILVLIMSTWLEYSQHAAQILANHTPKIKKHIISESKWWNQNQPILPVYTTNRIGKQIGLFNIQYLGSKLTLEKELTKIGWTKKQSSVFYSLMMRLDGKHFDVKLPIMEQLYLNKRPELIMIYHKDKNHNFYILRLWRSNYQITNYKYPIWIGSIILATSNNEIQLESSSYSSESIFAPLQPILKKYNLIDINTQNKKYPKSLKNLSNHQLLIFKN